jgi:hypothetical protein
MPSPIEAKIDAVCKCVRCGAGYGKCDCWKKCWCGISYDKTKPMLHCAHDPRHSREVDTIRTRFPIGTRVLSNNRRDSGPGTVVGYSQFPIDNWIRVKFDSLKSVQREPAGYFEKVK